MNATTPHRFHWRALTSVLMTLAFLVLAVSGTILFLAPPGRVANWTNWTALGLRKSDWGGLHIWFAAVFLGLTAAHVAFNLRPLLGYLRDRLSHRLAWRREWLVAAGACGVIFAGTLAQLPPFASFLAWNEALKESWDEPAVRAPIPHAELLSFAALAEKAGVDAAEATRRLHAAGVSGFEATAKVQEIATAAGISAQRIYELIRAGAPEATHAGQVGGGSGWKTLRQFCADEALEFGVARDRLVAAGIVMEENATMRDLAARAGRKPYELVAIIRGEP